MSLIDLIIRTATREELVELLRQHDTELVAERAKTTKLMELARAVKRGGYSGPYCDDVDGVNWFDLRDELLS